MELFLVGRVVKARGLHGEVKIEPMTSFPEKFKTRKKLYIGTTAADAVLIEVVKATIAANGIYLTFNGVSTPEAADHLRGKCLFVDEKNLGKLGKDEAFIHDLIGLDAVNEQGKAIGKVANVMNMPSCDVYEIETTKNFGGKRVMVPAIAEFIAEVDLAQRRVVVKRFEEFL
ncbi:MAG: hypothetical protein HY22_01545 [[Candidatus Thermochlorobacteriaceae] bacterium GBChlB]|nr:MAG: hypothetical protein HY22_01545 [[Candidatus Thermochlorobacteriaceae] bacterium GBChlB]